MRTRFIVTAAVVIAACVTLFVLPAPARQKPQPCPPARYVVTQGAGLIVGDSTPLPAVVDLATKQVALGAHCPLTSAAISANKKGKTTVKAHWASCGTVSKVNLKATLPSDCHTMTGTIRAKAAGAKKVVGQPFTAALSTCGDLVVDTGAGEECDGTGCVGGASCVSCRCVAPATTTTTTPGSSSTSTTLANRGTCKLSPDHVCNTAQDCPLASTIPPVTQDCGANIITGATCGNGLQELPETCDRGTDNCAPGAACPTGKCTSDCKLVGSCTGSQAACVTAADCPTGQGCCGNAIIETGRVPPDPGPPAETCDDGDTADADSCPATCHVDACTTTTTSFLASVRFTSTGGTLLTGLGVFVSFPPGKVRLLEDSKVTGAFGVSSTPQRFDYAFKAEAIKGSSLPATFLHMNFNTCAGAPAAVAGDFGCVVTDASDDQGNSVDPTTVTCTVTVP